MIWGFFMDRYDEDFLKKTIMLWQPYSKKSLTTGDAKTIIMNTVDLFNILIESEIKTPDKKNISKP